ncbi:MAG TPA: hypothetical protein VKC61_22880 [Pyrinomonadaceae bacterium]|nr:hypothetical protein [Pyrinomonadaceae bacterium]
MKKMLAFQTVAFDTLPIRAGQIIPAGEIELFTDDRDLDDDDVTKQGEEQILRWILSSCGRDLLLRELEVESGAFVALSVGPPIIERGHYKPGDIDLLICEDNRADLAIGIQCKRVKVKALSQEDDHCNKLPDITGGIMQVNRQRENLGFHRNYLMIVIETHGRNRSNSNVLFRGPGRDTLKEIYDFPRRESLHPDVGVIFVTVTQPTGKSFDQMSVIGVCVDQDAARLDQTAELTNPVREFMGR